MPPGLAIPTNDCAPLLEKSPTVSFRGRKLPLQEAAPRLLHLLRLSWLLAVANLALGRAAAAARLVTTGLRLVCWQSVP